MSQLSVNPEQTIPAFNRDHLSANDRSSFDPSSVERSSGLIHIDLIHDETPARTRLDQWLDTPMIRPTPVHSVTRYGSIRAYLMRATRDRGRPTVMVLNVGDRTFDEKPISGERYKDLLAQIQAVQLIACSAESGQDIRHWIDLGVDGFITPELEDTIIIQGMLLALSGGLFIPKSLMELALCEKIDIPLKDLTSDHGNETLRYQNLTERERQVFAILRIGKSNKVIAYELGLQESTVKVHVRNIMQKFKATSRTHVVYLANRIKA